MIRDHSSVVVMLLPLMLPNPVLLQPPLLQLTHAAVAVTHTTTDHLSEGQSGTRKCTLIGTWAGTQGGLSRDSKRVNSFGGMVPYMAPIFVIRYAMRRRKNFT